jgi:ATP-binding cassette subfamily F protein 3
VEPQTARNVAGAMMFEGDDALKKIQVLSGGEKSRVILGKLLVTPVSLLLLDEPTNHLDMESTDAMLAAIDNFDGTVILVTHNEMFLHAIAKRLIVFQNDQIDIFEGEYQDFLNQVGWQEDEPPAARSENYPQNSKLTKKKAKRLRSDCVNARAKILTPLKDRIRQIEKHIEEQEKKLHAFTLAMQKASESKESARIQEISKSIHKCQTDIDRSFDELEHLTQTYEESAKNFEEQLQSL